MDHSEIKHLPKTDHTPAYLDKGSKLLLKAANLIEERGHNKGCYESEGRLCIMGALKVAAGIGMVDYSQDAMVAVGRLMKAVNSPVGFTNWNDAPERTQCEVVAKMRAVALGL